MGEVAGWNWIGGVRLRGVGVAMIFNKGLILAFHLKLVGRQKLVDKEQGLSWLKLGRGWPGW